MKKTVKKIYNSLNLINTKYKDLFKTKLRYILQFFPSNIYLFILFLLLVTIVTPKLINNKVCEYAVANDSKSTAIIIPKEIVKNSIYQEVDTTNIKKIGDIGVRFSTFRRRNTSSYYFILYKNEKVIYKKKIKANKLKDNQYELFSINSKVKENDKYKFEIKPINAKKGNAVAISKGENNNYMYGLFKKSVLYNETIVLAIIFLVLFFIVNLLINNGKIKNEEHYYKIMLIYFVIGTLVFPALFEPDSAYHFERAYTVSQNSIYNYVTTNNLKKGELPSNIECLSYGNDGAIFNEVSDKSKLIDCFNETKMVKKSGKIKMDNKEAFLLSGLGIKITMLFTKSPMVFFYIGRLFNTISSFLIILFALKIAPKHKRIFLTIVMIPVFIQQVCSYSYDSILNSLCILVIAYILKFFNDDKISLKHLIIFLISTILIFKIKLPYVLLSMPIIFIDKEKFGNKKINKYIYLFILLIVMGLVYVLPKLGNDMSLVNSASSERGMSLSSLFNIKYTIKLIYRTIKINTSYYLESLIGGLAWLNSTYMSKLLIYSYLVFICLSVISEKQEIKLRKLFKISIIIINLAIIGGIFLAMYLAWTREGALTIEGVQGRYLFAPILGIILCLIPKNNKIDISNETFYSFFNISCLTYLITILYLFY